ncbi:MAG: diguanylate cyclase domain-containing protein, partial [Gammaproteobacteria bacterium]
KQFAYYHHEQAIQQLAYLEINDLTEELKSSSLDLALAIENESDFIGDVDNRNLNALRQHTNNQFYQYFVTAGVLKLLKIYILNTHFTLLSVSSEGIKTDLNTALICPQLGQSGLARRGSEKLHTLSDTCIYKDRPVYAVLVPFGGLNPKGYIQVMTDLSYSLRKIEQSLAMPVQMNSLDGQLLYQSNNWTLTLKDTNYLTVDLPILNNNGKPVMTISVKPDMTTFNKDIIKYRNWTMALTLVTTTFIVFIVLFILRKSTIPPLAKIHDVLEKIHLHSHASSKNSRLLFEQLLEQIIKLKRKYKTCFSVMIMDLTHFKNVNRDYGTTVGDQILIEVEQRLSTILRDSDLISWVGTDSPGHKLLPSDAKTNYRATIARLGGDEFGLLLPSAQTREQAIAVAQRIIKTLNKPFLIKGNTINIECRIGISIYPTHGEDEKILIRSADKAMHQAKLHNQTSYVFDPDQEIPG